MNMLTRIVILLICAMGAGASDNSESSQAAQAAKPAAEAKKSGGIQIQGTLRSRFEGWNWFDPGADKDPDYLYMGNLLRLSFSQQTAKLDWQLELAAPILLGLPNNSVAPAPAGQLGTGATYYASNDNHRNAAMLFPKQGFLRFKSLGGNAAHSMRVGRFEYLDGTEMTPKNATLAALKRDRINQRLLGGFGWTHVGRSFDGLHYVANHPTDNFTFIAAIPTRGVFQVDGWGEVKVGFGYGAYTKQWGKGGHAADTRVLGIYYHDWRHVLKTDNRTQAARAADMGNIRIGSFGGHSIHAIDTSGGTVDLLVWGVAQTGRWGRLDHRALAIAGEAGFQPKVLPKLKPWFRGGYFYGSGDGDPSDQTHNTFFQVLPTPRPFARFPFFNLVNNSDIHGAMILRPHPKFSVSTEFHALQLTKRQDLWYLGGGAYQPWTFGYVGRPSNGAQGLANLYDVSVDVRVNPKLSLNGYFGYANGRTVIRKIYPKDGNGLLAYIETTWRFW